LTKVIEIGTQKKVEILTLEYFQTPSDNSGVIDRKVFFERLFEKVSAAEVKSAAVGISLPFSALNFCLLDLPKMPKSELDPVILREARRRIKPVPAAEDIVKYAILSTVQTDTEAYNIFTASANKEEVSQRFSLFRSQRIEPVFAGASQVSLINLFLESFSPSDKNMALIDIGFKNTVVAIFIKDRLTLMRQIAFGGSDFIDAISKKEGMAAKKAEDLFFRGEITEKDLFESQSYLLSEIRRSFAYHKEITKVDRIDQITFCGGTAKVPSVFEFLTKNISGELGLFDLSKLKNVSVGKLAPQQVSLISPMFFTAFGVALGAAGKGPGLNFLPQEVVVEKRKKQITFVSLNSLFVVTLILGIAVFTFLTRLFVGKASLGKLKGGFSEEKYRDFTGKAAAINSRKSQLESQQALIARIDAMGVAWKEVLVAISKLTPPNIFLEEMMIVPASGSSSSESEGGMSGMMGGGEGRSRSQEPFGGSKTSEGGISLKMKGAIVGTYEESEKQLAIFCDNLESSGLFADTEFTPLKLESLKLSSGGSGENLTPIKERKFTITAKITGGEK